MLLGCDGVVANLVKVAAVQFEHHADDKQYNLGRVGHFAGRAAAAGARLVVCPEMCLTGYWHLRRHDAKVLRGLAEPADGPSVSAVRALARRLGAGIGAGFLESAAAPLIREASGPFMHFAMSWSRGPDEAAPFAAAAAAQLGLVCFNPQAGRLWLTAPIPNPGSIS
jgi:hypothetical protein